MAKVTNPLMSCSANGSIGQILNFQNQAGMQIARQYKATNKQASPSQKVNRLRYATTSNEWLKLPIEIRQDYVKRAEKEKLSGFNLFLKEQLTQIKKPLKYSWDDAASKWDGGQSVWMN